MALGRYIYSLLGQDQNLDEVSEEEGSYYGLV